MNMKNRLTELRRIERELTPEEEIEMTQLKNELYPNVRNVTVTTVYNKQGSVLSVKQSQVIVNRNEQKDTEEIGVVI